MTDITELALRLKLEAHRAVSNFNPQMNIKTRDLKELVEALEKAQLSIAELEREQEHLRPVGVMSEKASLRVENSKSRFIELWLRLGIFLPHKRPEHSMSYYAGMAVLTGTKAEIY